ncbi:hypothetical protein [Streptomyces sp. NBC_00102]|uniref:hypothetical protein n=1 Tax=Streptomyces sp. NBC_00102 TaxID=2975652 RepID=UPI0022503843|nr:hypothetical protein [Streptomyces sp. NBC_00102]MCX5396972.1 hypothetical protein [Streptomyces sp. NBC_00102]
METLLLILALLFVAFVGLGVYVGVKAVKAAKRGVDRTFTQARRTVEETTLRAKGYGRPGVAGELAQLRLSLRTAMRATQETLGAGIAEDASLSESLGLFHRLSAHGRELDDELRRLEREPDRATVETLMPGLRERTERITRSADSLRWAARDRARRFADDDLDALNAQIDVEAGALRHWTVEEPVEEPVEAPRTPRSSQAPRSAGPSRTSGAPHGSGQSQGFGPAGPGAGPEAARELPESDPTARISRLWQKSARPETTN